MEEEDRWELLDTKDKKRKARRPTFVTDEEEAEIARSAAVLHASLRRANIDPDQVAARGGGRGLLIETEVLDPPSALAHESPALRRTTLSLGIHPC